MRATGIVRRLDDLGRIVIPRELRRNMGVREGAPLEMFLTKEGLIMKPYLDSTPSRIRGIAEELESMGNTPKEWKIATELKKIANELENLDD